MTPGVCLLMNLCEPCTCSPPLLVMLILEGVKSMTERTHRSGEESHAAMSGRAMICIAFPSHRAEGTAGGGASFWKRVVGTLFRRQGEGARWVPMRKESIRQILDRQL